jgi:hypothetical protein
VVSAHLLPQILTGDSKRLRCSGNCPVVTDERFQDGSALRFLDTASQSAFVDFTEAAADVANLDYVGIFDAASGGNLLFSKALPGGPFAVAAGTPIKFLTGDLTFTIGAAS